MLLVRWIAQGVLAGQAIQQMHINMRPGTEGGQGASIGQCQFKAADIQRFGVFGDYFYFEHGCTC
ncbi:hypothetical protein D3C73_1613490 [compost metagenome]